jgi:fermentation-respiration switch protein FrsA (DUF1100 family)
MAVSLPSLFWPLAWVVMAGLSARATLLQPSPGLAALTVVLSLGATYATGRVLRGRRLSHSAWLRLGVWVTGWVVIGLVGLGIWLAHERAYGLVHPGHRPATLQPEAVGLTDYQSVSFLTEDGLTLRGWYMPTHNGAVIVFVHGHGGNRGAMLADAEIVVAQGYGALLYDTRNAGESEGDLTTFGLLEVLDVGGAVDFALAQPQVKQVALFGHSMGGGIVLMAGARLPQVRAVVAESAFSSLEDNIANGVRHLTGLPPFPFAPLVVFFGQREAGMDIRQARPIDDIAALSPRPVLVIHGQLDETIPVANAHALYAAAQAPKELYLLPEAGHDELAHSGGADYRARVLSFLDRYLLQSP